MRSVILKIIIFLSVTLLPITTWGEDNLKSIRDRVSDPCFNVNCDAVKDYIDNLKKAVKVGNRNEVANYMDFPLRINKSVKGTTIHYNIENKNEFIQQYNSIMTEHVKFRILTSDSKDIIPNFKGIGFNLDQKGADAVIWELDLTLDFLKMKSEEKQPSGGLSDEQINKLLYLSLIGVSNEKGHFKGLVEQLKDRLTHFNLANIQFKPHQLIALQSLAFNNPGKLIGPQLCKTLKNFDESKKEHDLMLVLQQIMECSNKLFDDSGEAISYAHGIQNRRMREAGMFFGGPAAIHISYRQYKRIEAAFATRNEAVLLKNGQPIYSQLYGEEDVHKKFSSSQMFFCFLI